MNFGFPPSESGNLRSWSIGETLKAGPFKERPLTMEVALAMRGIGLSQFFDAPGLGLHGLSSNPPIGLFARGHVTWLGSKASSLAGIGLLAF